MDYNGIILLNKEQGPTSHDMVYEMRRIFNTRKVGHTGTLDPMATGVLPICIGNATKASDMLLCEKKEYIAEIKFGFCTDTGDVTGNITKSCEYIPDIDSVKAAAKSFCGEIMQVPPMYSAKKQNGRKLYELARSGQVVERAAVPVEIYSAEVLGEGTSLNTYSIKFSCSKGTYIRTLCEDIGKELGTCACMSALCRTASGEFRIENSHTVSELKAITDNKELRGILIPTHELFDYDKITLSNKQSDRMKNGVFVSHPGICEGERYRVFDSDNIFFAVARCVDGRLRIEKSFRV